ncbi:MAG: hypothetical protein ACRCUP_01255 [Mycoplasmatales bacterium]
MTEYEKINKIRINADLLDDEINELTEKIEAFKQSLSEKKHQKRELDKILTSYDGVMERINQQMSDHATNTINSFKNGVGGLND